MVHCAPLYPTNPHTSTLSGGNLCRERPLSGDALPAPARAASAERRVEPVAAGKREAERRGERIARAVGVGERARSCGRLVAAPVRDPAAARPRCARRARRRARRRSARRDRCRCRRAGRAARRPRAASGTRAASRRGTARARGRMQRSDIARDEEDGVVAVERQRPAGQELRPERRDRPLAGVVDERERPSRRSEALRVDVEPELGERRHRSDGRARRLRAR